MEFSTFHARHVIETAADFQEAKVRFSPGRFMIFMSHKEVL